MTEATPALPLENVCYRGDLCFFPSPRQCSQLVSYWLKLLMSVRSSLCSWQWIWCCLEKNKTNPPSFVVCRPNVGSFVIWDLEIWPKSHLHLQNLGKNVVKQVFNVVFLSGTSYVVFYEY